MVFEQIENVIWEDAGNRGIISYASRGELKHASTSLLTAEHVAIVSGFYIEKCQTGETDGPLGTLFLAQALEKLSIKVTLLTSSFNREILSSGVEKLRLQCQVIEVNHGSEFSTFTELLSDDQLTHLVAIEQMGSAMDGKYYNMSGADISPFAARFDSFFLTAKQQGIVTIGIGDGGNEIGMGNIFSSIRQNKELGHTCCITPTDYLIISGVSNWGAYGLISALSFLTGKPLLHRATQEKELLQVIIEAGAVDGRTLENSLSVDALPVSKHMEIVEKLWHINEASSYPQRQQISLVHRAE